MMLSTGEAAAAVGMTKQGILAAIHKGRLSATRDDNGRFEVDPSELFRVYDPVATQRVPDVVATGNSAATNGKLLFEPNGNEVAATPGDPCESCRQQMALMREMLSIREDEVSDLRRRLDASTAQVDQMSAVIAQLQPKQAKTGWWQRLLGGGA